MMHALPNKPAVAATKEMSEEQRRAVAAIAQFQGATGMSDVEFVRELPMNISTSTWSRLRAGEYQGDVAGMVGRLEKAARQLRETWALSRERARTHCFYDFPDFKAVILAVKEAKARALRGEEDKLVVYTAPSGWGKSHLAHELVDNHGAVEVVAREGWRHSYFNACVSIARAVGLQEEFNGAARAQDALLTQLQAKPCLLVLNEVEFFSRAVLNLMRTILNETRCSILMLCIPEFFRMLRMLGGLHSSQLMRRAVAVIEAKRILPLDAERFWLEAFARSEGAVAASQALAAAASQALAAAASAWLAAAANQAPNGATGYGYKLIARVMESLAEQHGGEAPALAEVEKEIALYQARLALR